MPSITARKSSRRRPNCWTARARPASRGTLLPRIERVDVGAPAVELRAGARRAARVESAISSTCAAERIDLEHRLALRARQDAHRRVEGAARRALGGRHIRRIDRRHRSGPLRLGRGRERPGRSREVAPRIRPTRPRPAVPALPRCTRSLSGSRTLQHRGEALAQGLDDGDLQREPRYPRSRGENGAAVAQQRLAGAVARACGCRRSSAGEARSAPSASTVAPASANASSGM